MKPIILAISQFCQRLDFGDPNWIGKCMAENYFGGDYTLVGILLSILFFGLIVRYNFPLSLMLPFGLALTYTLWLISSEPIFLAGLMFCAIIGGAVLIIGLLKYLNR